jgi:hypothetical protein
MSQHPPTPQKAGSDPAPEIITDLNYQLLPKMLGAQPGPDVIRNAEHSGTEHFLRTVGFSDLLRFDRQAVHQLIQMRQSLPSYMHPPFSAGGLINAFEAELYKQRMYSLQFYNIAPNAALIWGPTKELFCRLMHMESPILYRWANPHLPDFTEMHGLRLIACEQPGISVAWLPSLHDPRK